MLVGMSQPAGHRAGACAEELVARRLVAAGWRILGRNVRVGRGELDLVAVDPGPPAGVVVIEVRWRGRRDFGLAEETLDRRKRAALRRSVGILRTWDALPDGMPMPHLPLRVDLVALDPGPGGEPSVRHHRGIRL
jgi:putative endonuclease